MYDLIILLVLLTVGYTVGTIAERRHFKSLERREQASLRLPTITAPDGVDVAGARRVRLVQGSAVISVDYFKRFLARLRNIFGGRVKSYESLLDRARREAILRMKAQAVGSAIIVNMRVETATIGGNRKKKAMGSIEAFAYGTAIWIEPLDEVRTQTP